MDWPGSRGMYGFERQPAGEDDVDEAEEDFYGLSASANGVNGDTYAGSGANEQVCIPCVA